MNEKSFKYWLKFHRLGKFKFLLLMVFFYIIIGNIVNSIINNMIMLTFKEIIISTVIWGMLGMCISTHSWKSNECAYDNYLKQNNKS